MLQYDDFSFDDEMDGRPFSDNHPSSTEKLIENWVRSGLKTRDELVGAFGKWSAEEIDAEISKKMLEESAWPEVTDADKLEKAFAALSSHGILDLWGIDGDHDEEVTWTADCHADDYRQCVFGGATGGLAAVYYTWDEVLDAIDNGVLVLHVRGFEEPGVWTRDLAAASARLALQEALEDVGLCGLWSEKHPHIVRVPLQWQRRQPVQSVETHADRNMSEFSKAMRKSVRRMGYRWYGEE
jgi:hypothetical protein